MPKAQILTEESRLEVARANTHPRSNKGAKKEKPLPVILFALHCHTRSRTPTLQSVRQSTNVCVSSDPLSFLTRRSFSWSRVLFLSDVRQVNKMQSE